MLSVKNGASKKKKEIKIRLIIFNKKLKITSFNCMINLANL
jgi:hypothetical protein